MNFFTSNFLKFNCFSVGLVLFMVANSCKKTTVDPQVVGEAKVKMINTVSTDQPQNVFVDQIQVTNTALAFSEESDYLKISSGNKSVKFSSSASVSIVKDVNYTSSLSYSTYLIADKTGAKDLLTVEDNFSTNESNKAKIRIINLSPNFSTGINVMVSGGVQFVNAQMFKDVSNYFFVDPSLDLKYNVVGSGSIKTISAGTLVAGKVYNLWFSGSTTTNLLVHLDVNN